MTSRSPRTLALAFTGASGMPFGLRVLDCMLRAGDNVMLVYSPAAQIVARQECGLVLSAQPREAQRVLGERYGAREGQLRVYGHDDWMAPIASGSNPPDAMAVCPCSMGTLGALAGGLADNLIERAADVMLKERRALVLVPRETPLSAIHLQNMLTLAHAGAVILPPVPAFYTSPQSVADIVDFVVARILDHLGVVHSLVPRWGAPEESAANAASATRSAPRG